MASTSSMLVTLVVGIKHGVQCFCGSRMHGDGDSRFSRDVILCSALFCSQAPSSPLPVAFLSRRLRLSFSFISLVLGKLLQSVLRIK